jgi:hypothetical protein
MSNYLLRIVFKDLDADLIGVDLHIYLEDISEADAAAELLGQQTILNVTVPRNQPVYLASLEVPAFGAGAQVSVRVHVDTSGSATPSPGDYLSTSVCSIPRPVPAEGVVVHVHRI